MSHPPPSNPAVFVVGCPRSGTTLLQRMLDSHPELAVANDTHFIPRVLEQLGRETDIPLDAALVERVRSYRRFGRLGLDDARVEAAARGATTYAGFVSRLYDELARASGKPRAGEKTPDYVRRIGMLHRLFPHAKFIHIVRDGRDVALSTLEWATPTKGPGRLALWSEDSLAVAALWWRWNVLAPRETTVADGMYTEVLYEQLVSSPAAELTRLADFLGLPQSDAMLSYHVGRERSGSGLSAKSAWQPPVQGLRDWRRDLAAADVALFECLAGDALDAFGYARSDVVPSGEITERAERRRIWWDEEMQRRELKHQRRQAAANPTSV